VHGLGQPDLQREGLERPCYLSPTPITRTFEELMNKTPLGELRAGERPRCEHCMAHCGFEPSAALGINAQPATRGSC